MRVVVAAALTIALAIPVIAGERSATGVQAIDGDSIEVRFSDGTVDEVRLLSIDCPEHDQAFSRQAREFTNAWIKNKPLLLRTGPKERDPHDRLLAFVDVESRSLNELIVDAGLAVVWVIPPNTDDVDVLLTAQRDAWKEKRGIWGPDGPTHDPRSHRGDTPRPLRYEHFVVYGNKRSRIAHWPGCLHVDEMSTKNIRRFSSMAAALKAGFRMEHGSR